MAHSVTESKRQQAFTHQGRLVGMDAAFFSAGHAFFISLSPFAGQIPGGRASGESLAGQFTPVSQASPSDCAARSDCANARRPAHRDFQPIGFLPAIVMTIT
jgi:hypothetical protein